MLGMSTAEGSRPQAKDKIDKASQCVEDAVREESLLVCARRIILEKSELTQR